MKRYSKQEQALFLKNRKPSQNTISEPHTIPEIMKTYRGHFIEKTLTGWFTCFIVGHGTLKADSLAGIKEVIKETKQ